ATFSVVTFGFATGFGATVLCTTGLCVTTGLCAVVFGVTTGFEVTTLCVTTGFLTAGRAGVTALESPGAVGWPSGVITCVADEPELDERPSIIIARPPATATRIPTSASTRT